MKTRPPARPPLLFLFCLAVLGGTSAGCQVNRQAFQEKIYSCNPNATNPACGKDSDGQPMACVATYQLGGRNFCASSCQSTPVDVEGPTNVCLRSGARLPACKPGDGELACGNKDLACLRTDLYKDEGICMNISLCATHGDCRDPVRSTCMGQLLTESYPKAAFNAQSTYCLQAGCRANRTACSPGETCLRDVLPRDSNPADICVPNCDSNQNCPPNYLCVSRVYSKPSPSICVPGLMGLRCKTRLDCLVGDCVPTGGGYNVCTIGCDDDNACAKYDSEFGTLFCARGPDGQKTCQGARAYTGGICVQDSDCNTKENEICHWPTENARSGYCQRACEPTGACPSLGGVAHTCLPQILDPAAKLANPASTTPKGPPGCYPGYFGLPCLVDAQCMGADTPGRRDLSCIKPTEDSPFGICTTPCQNRPGAGRTADSDCAADRLTKDGWCPAKPGEGAICLTPLADDAPCERDAQCASKKCISTATGTKCDKTPGY